MKVGHYTPPLLSPGGITSYLHRVVEGQLLRGHEVVLFERGHCTPRAMNAFGVEVVRTADDYELHHHAGARKLDVLHAHCPLRMNLNDVDCAAPSVVRTIHGHEAYCPSGARYLARSRIPCPRKYTLAGCAWGHFVDRCGSVRPKKLLSGFETVWRQRRDLPRCQTIVISEFAKTQMMRSGYDADRISVVYNPAPVLRTGADISPANRHGPPLFLFLGRIVPGKGLRWLIEAAVRSNPSAHFLIVGDGPEKMSLQRLTASLGVDTRFAWQSWLHDPAEVSARLAAARAVIFPSLWHEPAGLVPLEAAAMRRPVIASRVGGIPEYAERLGHALLVEAGDVRGLAAAISKLTEGPDLAEDLGLSGWKKLAAGEFGLNDHLDRLEQVYASSRPPITARDQDF